MNKRITHRVGVMFLLLAGLTILAACNSREKENAESPSIDSPVDNSKADDLQVDDNPTTGALIMPDYDMEIRGRIARFTGGTVMLITEDNGPIVLSGNMNFDGLKNGDDVTIYCSGIMETYPAKTTVVEMTLHERGSAQDLPEDTIKSLAGLNYTLEEAESSNDIKDDAQTSENSYTRITMEELKARLSKEEGYILLDVRRLDEYSGGHLPGAINLANEDIGKEKPDILSDTNQRIYVYCRSGNRSKEAAQKLVDMGYTDIVECGGILDWTGEIEK